jgi:hypothetical protein
VARSAGWPDGGYWRESAVPGRHLLDDLKHYVEHGTPSPRKRRHIDRAAAHPRPGTAGR